MRPAARVAGLWLASAVALGLACGESARDGDVVERLLASGGALGGNAAPGTLKRLRDGREEVLTAVAVKHPPPGWKLWSLRAPAAEAPLARLALASDEAALLLHAASREPAFASAVAENRLVRLATADGERLALWLDAAPASRVVAFAELATDEAARLVATAQALGGWGAIARDRYPVAADGSGRLPLFVPAPLGDWRALRQRSLEFFLPPALGASMATRPGFRAARDRVLSGLAAELNALAASALRIAEALPEAEHVAVAEALALQARENAEVFAGYLDSTWIELVIERSSEDAARLRIFVHSAVDLRLEALQVELPGKVLVTESASLAGLRLAPVGEGDAVRAHLGRDRLELRIRRSLPPAARGVETFWSTELEYELTGLAPLGPQAASLLAGLRVRATNAATNARLADHQVQRLLSVAAERFEIGDEPGIEAFLAGAPRVLLRAGGGAPVALRLDRAAQRLVLPAGDYRLVADFVPPADFGLVLEAGVSLRVDPGRSLLIRGPLEVRGTAANPVRVQAAKPSETWGVLALQGRGRSRLGGERPRSRLQHLELSGGSQDQLKGVAYAGQLSVHHQELVLRNAVLSRSMAGAALSVKHGTLDLRDSVFVDNQRDAVDLVRAQGRVAGCFFGRSGRKGDGLDLSGSSLVVTDSVFGALRDECVSLGEASTLRLEGSLLRGCDVALASRDGSVAAIEESVLLENDRNFAAVAKRASRGGATIRGRDLLLVAASKPDERDAVSTIALDAATTIPHPEESDFALGALRTTQRFSRERFRALSPSGAEAP